MNSPVVPIRRVFRVVNGGTPSASPENWDGNIAWATPADLAGCDGARILSTQRALTPVGLESGSNLVPGGGLIISSRAPIGYVAETVKSTAINQGCKGLIPKQEVDIRFFRYQLSAMTARLQSLGQGSTFLEISSEALASCPISVPPLSRQRETADFLDIATARIDALILKKCHLIQLLTQRWNELRRTQILGGLEPVGGGGSYRSWPEISLGILIDLQRGHDLPSHVRVEGTIPVVGSGGISGFHNKAIAEGPGVVTGRYGTIGEVIFIDDAYWPLNTTLYVKDFRGNDPKWIYHLLSSIPLEFDSAKSAVGGINRNVVGQLRVPSPTIDEQVAIAATLESMEQCIVTIVQKLRLQIKRLDQRKKALATAAVTG